MASLACYLSGYNKKLVNVSNDKGITPLMWACANKNKSLVERFINRGAQVDAITLKKKRTALMIAAQERNNKPVVKRLIKVGSLLGQQDTDGKTAYDLAANAGNFTNAILIKKECDAREIEQQQEE